MIQIYKRENTDFQSNGDSTIFPSSCILQAKLNDAWEMTMNHPLDEEGRWKYIEEEAVICAPTFQGPRQKFRIRKIEKSDTEITATAYPIFFDSAKECFLLDTRPKVKNGQQALDIMTNGTRYSGESDIKTTSTAYFVRRNLMDAIHGEEEPTFIQRWGGEILYDNYKVIINEHVGGDYGNEVRYGKNMNGISYQVDMSEMATRIVPVAYNGYTLPGDSPWVDSPNINKYTMPYVREMKFDNVKLQEDAQEDEEVENGTIICKNLSALYEALRQECKNQFELSVDLPKVTIDVNMVDISKTKEYEDYKVLETIGLGDTIHCRHSKLNITTDARVIELGWDCIRNISENVKLGEFAPDYFTELTSAAETVRKIIGPGNTVVAERVKGVLNAINTQLRYQKNAAQRQDVRAILFEDLDVSSSLYGALAIGTQGFQIADRRTADGRDWDWSTAFTAKGGYADILVSGILSDKTGKSFWNLDTGEMQLTGVFRQFATNGFKSVDIQNNRIQFYDWAENGERVGCIGSTRNIEKDRAGITMWCDKGDLLRLSYDNGEEEKNIIPFFSFDSRELDRTPWIINTVSGTLFGGIPGGGIKVENGLIKDWSMKGIVSGTLKVGDTEITVKDGLIMGWKKI